jgi:SAM-dependent methyltransferase
MVPVGMRSGWPELSDLIVEFDPDTGDRRPVLKAEVLDRLRADGNRRGAAIVGRVPAIDGVLDPAAVDRELVACHYEIQRLALELQQGPRMARLLAQILGAVRATDPGSPLRVVDVGCGIGYVLRWVAAHRHLLPAETELVGADFNPALVAEARRLAALEGLPVQFRVADAFQLEAPATVFMSSGVLHHVPRAALPSFFAAQAGARVSVHADFQQHPLGPWGAWLMHLARMERPLARHDGVLSAVRAHPADVLLDSAAAGLPGRRHQLVGTRLLGPIPRAMHALVSAEAGGVAEQLPW